MEFWGIEVKPGETLKCEPGDDKYLHLSQASLGEVKKDNKGNESVPIFVKFNDQKLVIGTLSTDKCPQIAYDLVFEKEFELSHNWKHGSVFFVGYKTIISEEPDDLMDDVDSDSEDEGTPVKKEANGKSESKVEAAKPKSNVPKADSLTAKPSVKAEEQKTAKEQDDDDSNVDDSEEGESDDEDMLGSSEDESDDEDEDESSEEEDDGGPKKVDGKKRPAGPASKTPVPHKKAKLVTPVGSQKTGGGADGKKGGHTATPYPTKQAGKTPATKDKSKQQTPKSAGSVSCKSCSRTFKDDNALQAHTKAKHAGK